MEYPQVNPKSSSAGLRYVGFWPRLLARFIDFLFLFIVLHLFHLFIRGTLFIAFNELLTVAYLSFFWLRYGATLGNMIFRQRIITEQGQPLDVNTVLKRLLVATLSDLAFGIPYISVALDAKKQGLHDKFARTYVIRGDYLTNVPRPAIAPPDPAERGPN